MKGKLKTMEEILAANKKYKFDKRGILYIGKKQDVIVKTGWFKDLGKNVLKIEKYPTEIVDRIFEKKKQKYWGWRKGNLVVHAKKGIELGGDWERDRSLDFVKNTME